MPTPEIGPTVLVRVRTDRYPTAERALRRLAAVLAEIAGWEHVTEASGEVIVGAGDRTVRLARIRAEEASRAD